MKDDRTLYAEQRKRIFALYVWLIDKENGNTNLENDDIRYWMDELIGIYANLRNLSNWGTYEDDLYPILSPEDLKD